ncbi:MAG: 50S ribosomal protein L10 [Candidatus Omnitrophica bacterium]|nr:50S ribosomal protein L10 [Candidatus Omnitrophota bacterium]
MSSVGRLVKESIVRDAAAELSGRTNLFIASVPRLPAAEANTFRRQLSGSQARLIMIKRRLGKRALESLKIPGLEALLEGSVGIVLPGADDVLPTAKVLVEFGKAREEQLFIRGALIDGQLLDGRAVKELAALPAKPVLLAQVLGTIEAPMADVIFTIERLIGDLAWLAEEAAKAKPLPAAPAAQAGRPAAQTEAPAAAAPAPTPEAPPSEQQHPKPEGGAPA